MEYLGNFVTSLLKATVLPESAHPKAFWVQYLTYYLILAGGAVVFYLGFSTFSYLFFFRWRRAKFYPETLGEDLSDQIKTEIKIALTSLPFMAILMAPFPVMVARGYSRVYKNVDDYGWGYLLFSIPLFLFCTDMMIYFIHRGLHLPFLYQRIHKPHHTYRFTTPYSSHAFHPVDGWAQGVPYYIFCFIFPFHHILFVAMFVFVNFWTISIHDQVDFCGAGIINSTGHHTIHHRDFLYNYGQYFTLWDRICGSYKPAEQTNSMLTGERIPHKTETAAKGGPAASADRNSRTRAVNTSKKAL